MLNQHIVIINIYNSKVILVVELQSWITIVVVIEYLLFIIKSSFVNKKLKNDQ